MAAVALVAGFYWGRARTLQYGAGGMVDGPPAEAPAVIETRTAKPAAPPPGPVPATLPRVDRGAARIALVIDDLGRSPADVERLSRLNVPWTGAVLPFESRTAEVVAALRRKGVEYLCHLPMQPQSANPGPGALRSDMTAVELAAATRAALDSVPGALGVNNHMGSVLSADSRAMRPILGELASRGLFYVDSRTSADSVGYRLARELGLPATERQVFLDADPAEPAVKEQFSRLLREARERGAALAIGHPHEGTFAVLEREVPRAVAAGYEFVPASYLLDRPASAMEP